MGSLTGSQPQSRGHEICGSTTSLGLHLCRTKLPRKLFLSSERFTKIPDLPKLLGDRKTVWQNFLGPKFLEVSSKYSSRHPGRQNLSSRIAFQNSQACLMGTFRNPEIPLFWGVWGGGIQRVSIQEAGKHLLCLYSCSWIYSKWLLGLLFLVLPCHVFFPLFIISLQCVLSWACSFIYNICCHITCLIIPLQHVLSSDCCFV